MKKWNNNWEKQILKYMIGVLVFFSLFIALFDILGISEWASVVCAFMSVVTAIVLGTMTVIQNKRAEEANERLARINQEQLEASIINNNYPMIKFSENQRIQDSGKTFILRFFDIRNTPLKEVVTRNIEYLPYEKKYKPVDDNKKTTIRKSEVKDVLKFTYPHNGSNEGVYTIKIPVNKLFGDYRYARIELEMDIIGTTGVVARYKAYVLMDKESGYKGVSGKDYHYVYDQSLEIREIISEKKYYTK